MSSPSEHAEPDGRSSAIEKRSPSEEATRSLDARTSPVSQPSDPAALTLVPPSAPAAVSSLDVGQRLGPYELLDKLGQGGMGAVYKARHQHLDMLVAVKVLPQQFTQQSESVARFKREMKAVGRLRHPNIVRAMDAGEINGTHYLAMEYIEGHDLAKLVATKGAFSVTNACKAIKQAAQALAAAHQAGLVHRDIKPSNLLLAKSGQIKILDLGLALLGEESGHTSDVTAHGQTFGTPDYMAPEQWADSHAVDARTDLYALGCTLYFLLVGHAPYADEKHRTPLNKMNGHITEPAPELSTARADVPDAVVSIYRKLMAKAPGQRYQSAQELVETLTQFAAGKSMSVAVTAAAPILTFTDSATSALPKSSSSGTNVEPLISPTLLNQPTIVRTATPDKLEPASSATRRRFPRWLLVAVPVILCAAGVGFWAFLGRGDPETANTNAGAATTSAAVSANDVPAWVVEQKRNYAVQLRNGVIKFPELIVDWREPWTIELSLARAVDSRPVSEAILSAFTEAGLGLTIWNDNPTFGMAQDGGFSDVVGTPDAVREFVGHQPFQLAFSFDGQIQRMWINGVPQREMTPRNPPLKPSTFTVGNGDFEQKEAYAFRGWIDELRVSRGVRYTGRYEPAARFEPDDKTVALYHFDEGRDDIAYDVSGGGHHAALTNAAWLDRSEFAGPGWPLAAPKPAVAPFDAEQAKKHQEEWAAYLNVPVEYTNSLGMKFVLIPPGQFLMGSTEDEIQAALAQIDPNNAEWLAFVQSAGPRHKVFLSQPIYLGATEVTQAQFEQVMGRNPSVFAKTGKDPQRVAQVAQMETSRHPVEDVSWIDAAEFSTKLSERENLKPFYFRTGETITPLNGGGYRLPTEAEWEFACRAGTTTHYWIGHEDDAVLPAGWSLTNSGGRTHAVGELSANPFGLYDIHGNVCEWVQDGYDAKSYAPYADQIAVDPQGSLNPSHRVLRGGGVHSRPWFCRSALRNGIPGINHHDFLGFRVALAVDAVRS